MKVSVLVITYNHEPFIRQAIESALIQEVNFPYEIVIGEDCSTDMTREIVIELQKQYPDKIRVLPTERNLGINRNLARTLDSCRGEFIALLEGDDYWTDKEKLQKQVDFLVLHQQHVACIHNVLVVFDDESEEPRPYWFSPYKSIITFEDLLAGESIPTCSTLFRNGLFGSFPEFFYDLDQGDWPLHVLNSQYGTIGYIDEIMGCYRVHSGGVFSSLSQTRKLEVTIPMYHKMNAYLDYKYTKAIQGQIAHVYYSLAVEYLIQGERAKSIECAKYLFNGFIGSEYAAKKHFVKIVMQLYMRPFYRSLAFCRKRLRGLLS